MGIGAVVLGRFCRLGIGRVRRAAKHDGCRPASAHCHLSRSVWIKRARNRCWSVWANPFECQARAVDRFAPILHQAVLQNFMRQ
jgi:hypothetical protein